MSATQELLEFIGSLPPTVNPYSATATKLEEAIRVGLLIILDHFYPEKLSNRDKTG
jgi:hypothetical protein